MFGKKKKALPTGTRMMHYEGLPGFPQEGVCFMEQTATALLFHQVDGPTATLPLEKVSGVDVMPERSFMGKYHGAEMTTAHGNAAKWFTVLTYDGGKRLAFWYLESKTGDVVRALQRQVCGGTANYTL